MQLKRTILVLALLVIAPGVKAGDWWQFRGPGGSGVSDEKNLPVSWSNDKNLDWKVQLPGKGASSPITLGKHIYLTCYSGYDGRNGELEDLMLHVVCLSREDGSVVWNKEITPKQPETERVRDHGWAAPTPATDGKHLYVFFGKTGVFAFDLEGNQKWQADVGSRTHGWGCGTSPRLYKDVVIINASVESGSLIGLDKKTGNEIWRQRGMRQSWNTPHLVQTSGGKTEVVVSVQGKILGYDPESGEPLWNCTGISDYVCPSIVSHEGIVYAIGGRQSRCIAVRAGGRGNVDDSHRMWETRAGANVSSPVVVGDYLFWTSDRNRTAYCVRRKDGEVMYREKVKGQPYASTAAGDGKLYVVTRFSGTMVLAAKPKYELLAYNKFDERSRFNASPVISNGKLLIRSDDHLYCVSKQ